MRQNKFIIALLLLLLLLPLGGCKYDFSQILGIPSGQSQAELFKVRIYFTDGQTIESYIKELGIHKEGKVYVGGSSLNYLYDAQGNIVGSYNYQRVLYIKVIPAQKVESS